MSALSERCEQRKAEAEALANKYNAGIEEAQKLNNANAQLLEQFKKKKDQYEELLDLVKEEEGVEQPATETVE
jgi:predicted nuclease with TOPRIM domain